MKIDLHIHSSYSSDSKVLPEEIIRQAETKGLDIVAITDHADFAIGDSCFNPDVYLAHMQPLKQQSQKVKLLCGVELGIQFEHADSCASFLADRNFDFVIGSMHRAGEQDFYNGEFFNNRSLISCWQTYFSATLKAVKSCRNFDVLGHLDIIRRYNLAKNTAMPQEVIPLLDELLLWLASNDKGIEINTSGLRYGLDSVHPPLTILQRFRQLGGEIVTIGSDSHTTATIGQDYDLAVSMLQSAGFKYLAWFENRQPQFAEL